MNQIHKIAALPLLAVALALGCSADAAPDQPSRTDTERSAELEALGVFDVAVDGDRQILLDNEGRRLGSLEQTGPYVEITLAGETAVLERRGTSLGVSCTAMNGRHVLDAPGELEGWLRIAAVGEPCVRAIEVARVITRIDSAHDAACTVSEIDGDAQLTCAYEEGEAPRNLGIGGCGCGGDGWGFCPAECWSCGGFDFGPAAACEDPWGDDPWGGGGGGGGSGLDCAIHSRPFATTFVAPTRADAEFYSRLWVQRACSNSKPSTACGWGEFLTTATDCKEVTDSDGEPAWSCDSAVWCTYEPV
ncbi:MAG: hypothetical protein AAF721_41820 [Myxococcota bacterium]